MGTITPDLSGITDGQVADAADITTPLNTIINEINGNLDTNNLASGAVTAAKIEVQQAWQIPTLLNSWVNLAGYETAGYMKDSLGFVHLKGVIGGGANGANSVFTLPEGYRPAARKSFAASYDTGSTRLDILPDGKIYVVPANSNILVGLSGIMFKAEV